MALGLVSRTIKLVRVADLQVTGVVSKRLSQCKEVLEVGSNDKLSFK